MPFVVAIDGPAGTGKGTITKIVGEKLNLINIDTGAMYRAVTVRALKDNIKPTEIEKIDKMMETINIEIKRDNNKQKIILDGEDITEEIRTPIIDDNVAKYAAIKSVREKMTPLQRNMRNIGNIIMEGRDIGTAVFPDAEVKIYLDASFEERANRRYKQNQEKGITCTYEEVLESIKQRHKLETEREIAPLKQAKDAIYIDSSKMTIEEVANKVIEIINNNYNNTK